jgi:hypothetical protein
VAWWQHVYLIKIIFHDCANLLDNNNSITIPVSVCLINYLPWW